MKMSADILFRRSRRGEAGFTMAEIAIALGVIAFALIAIIGILPAGLQVQKDNREETIINQDARLILEAIKSGGRDVTSDLGSFVVSTDGVPVNGIFTADLVRLLSDSLTTHTTIVSAISGGIASRGSDLAFQYQVLNNVMNPLFPPGSANAFGGTNLFGGVGEFDGGGLRLTNQVYDVRLRFAWPVKANGKLGPEANRYVARMLICGWYRGGVFYPQEFINPTNTIP
jgi:type II secretory pathway pseudopilin PulG